MSRSTSPLTVDILRTVATRPGLLAADIAAVLKVDHRRVGRYIAAAETAGWIQRPRQPDGTRPLALTDAGRQHLACTKPVERVAPVGGVL